MKKLFTIFFLILASTCFSQAVKISQLPAVSGTNLDSALVPVVQNGTTKKARGYMFGSTQDIDSLTRSVSGCRVIYTTWKNGTGTNIDTAYRRVGIVTGGLILNRLNDSTFRISAAQYLIGCSLYNSPLDTITLTGTTGTGLKRFYTLGFDNTNNLFALAGTPSANPQIPQVNEATQIGKYTVFFPAGSDSGITNIYNTVSYSGVDSGAVYVFTQLDSFRILACRRNGICDTIKSIYASFIDILTASNGIKRVGNDFRLQDTLNGAGDKFQWLPAKKAFRVGSASGTQNDIGNIGDYSYSFGQDNTAFGGYSVCFGLNNSANTTGSFAAGQSNIASGSQGFALGQSNTASGTPSFAFGSSNRATNIASTAIGNANNADAYAGAVFGFVNRGKSFGSFICGYYNDSTQRGSATSATTTGVIFAVGNGGASTRHSSLEMIGSGWLKVDATTSSTAAQSVLDVRSTTSGIILPRMTKAQRDAIVSPPAGTIIYQTDNTPGIRVYNGTNWMRFTETTD